MHKYLLVLFSFVMAGLLGGLSLTAVSGNTNPDQLAIIGEQTGMIASETATNPACTFSSAYGVYLCPEQAQTNPIQSTEADRAKALNLLGSGGLLLIPDSSNDRIMAFDPLTGNLVDANFIPADPDNLTTPINAIFHPTRGTIMVSDQLEDAVLEYTFQGDFVGLFAPAGGVITTTADNIRGIDIHPDTNHLLVTVGGNDNTDAIAEFDQDGNYIGNLINNGAGGLDSPYDIYHHDSSWLVSASSSDAIHEYDFASGAYLGDFSPVNSFPQQITPSPFTNTLLVANFSGAQAGIMEFDLSGNLIDVYFTPSLGGYRGIYELPNGNLLITNGGGVHEIDRNGNLIETKIGDIGARFIEYITLLPSITLSAQATTSNDCLMGSDTLNVSNGAMVTYCYIVTNTGPFPLGSHTVENPSLDYSLSFSYTLNPGESAIMSHTTTITMSTMSDVVWTAVHTPTAQAITALDTVQVNVGGIMVEKRVGTDGESCATTSEITVEEDSHIYYCLVIHNTGDVTFTTHTINDPMLNLDVTFPFTLTPQSTVSVTNAVLTSVLSLPPVFGPITATADMTNTLTFTATEGTLTVADSATAVVHVDPSETYIFLPFIMKP